MNTICVVGLGYVGLPTALVAAQNGCRVVGFDIDFARVQKINNGESPIKESGIHERLCEVLGNKTFYATTEVPRADYYVIAVPTPIQENHDADLSYVFSAIETIIPQVLSGNTIIVESTIPVGTTDKIANLIDQKTGLKVGRDVFVAHCPERVWPSNVFYELIHNDRVIGGITSECTEKAAEFYKKFVKGSLYLKNAKFAELLKLVENSSIDVSVALAHQVATLAEELGFDPYEVIKVANKHPRVKILTPTCGVGGHCVAIDPWFLVSGFPRKTRLFHAARLTNDERPQQVLSTVKKAIAAWQENNTDRICNVHLLGLAYKPNVDDLRESPALKVAQNLCKESIINVTISDPCVPIENQRELFGPRVTTTLLGIEQADIVVFLVGHNEFKNIDMHLLSTKILFDYSGLALKEKLREIGILKTATYQKEDVL